MKRSILLSIVVLAGLCVSAHGFDGQRKGFVLGGGAGLSAVSRWSVNVDFFDLDLGDYDENSPGLGIHFVIGGAFDEHNMLVYEGNAAGFNSDLFDESAAQGFNGAVWYHYFGPVGSSAFTALGLGMYYFKIGDYDPTSPGGGILLGGGYEFSPHWQVGAYLTAGKTNDSAYGLDGDFEHTNLSILVSGIAF